MTIIERQQLTATSVRNFCCEYNLYTLGTNAEYDAMFNMVFALYPKSIITGEDLYPIAADILARSKTDMDIESVMFGLGDKIIRSYEVID